MADLLGFAPYLIFSPNWEFQACLCLPTMPSSEGLAGTHEMLEICLRFPVLWIEL